MKKTSISIVLFASLGSGFVRAQTSAPANSLPRAVATLNAADLDKNGKLSAEEATRIPIAPREFVVQDEDKDGSWSRDEFLLYYRQRLLVAGQAVGADLEAETGRVQALRKAKEAEEARKHAATTSDRARSRDGVANSVDAAPDRMALRTGMATDDPARGEGLATRRAQEVDARLQAAFDDLANRAAAQQATRDDFKRVRSLVTTRAQLTVGEGPDQASQSDTYQKLQLALDRLEQRALENKYSREEYQAVKNMMIHRARAIEKSKDDPRARTMNVSQDDARALDTRLEAALADLDERASLQKAGPEDFKRVRDLYQTRARSESALGVNRGATNGDATQTETFAKLMSALARLEERALSGAYSREEYQKLKDMMIHRARSIEAGKLAAPERTDGLNRDGRDGLDSRLQSAVDDLETRSLAGRTSRDDFQRVRELLIAGERMNRTRAADDARSVDTSVQTGLYRKLMAALESLEKTAADRGLTREEFQELRTMLIQRARAAQNAPVAENRSAGETGRRVSDVPVRTPERASRRNDDAPPPPASRSGAGETKPDEPSRGAGRPAPPPQRPPSDARHDQQAS